MLSAPAMPVRSHGGNAMVALMLQTLTAHPAGLGRFACRARCSAVCGDGGLTRGGPDHRHSSTAAAEKLWEAFHEESGGDDQVPICTVWDAFHRTDIAAWRAIRDTPAAAKVFDVVKQLDFLFGQSEGILMFRGVAGQLGEKAVALRAPGGTRKIVYLSGAPGNLLRNYKIVRASLIARAQWAREGHSTQTATQLLELGRTLGDVPFVVFVMLLEDVLSIILRPFAVQVQGACEPATLAGAQRRLLAHFTEALEAVRTMRRLILVLTLCRQHIGAGDLGNLLAAHAGTRAAQLFPTFFQEAGNIVARAPPPPRQGLHPGSAIRAGAFGRALLGTPLPVLRSGGEFQSTALRSRRRVPQAGARGDSHTGWAEEGDLGALARGLLAGQGHEEEGGDHKAGPAGRPTPPAAQGKSRPPNHWL